MPYPRAYVYLTVLLLLTVPAFWQGYFSEITTVAWQYHVHGITATLWVLLLIWQSWSIHHGQRRFHRTVGLASLVLTPLFVAGGLLVIAAMTTGPGPFREMFGYRLAIVDLLSAAAFAGFVYGALRNRKNVGLHARYMLATPFLLFSPIAARLLPAFVPGVTIRTLEDLPRFGTGFQLSQALAIAFSLWLYTRNRRQSLPYLIAAGVLIVQSVAFETAGRAGWWVELSNGLAEVPPLGLALAGIVVGAAAAYFGWTGPLRVLKRGEIPGPNK